MSRDLPERRFSKRNQSRFGLSRQNLMPYKSDQLLSIITNRLGPHLIRLFEESALAFACRKVANLSGNKSLLNSTMQFCAF